MGSLVLETNRQAKLLRVMEERGFTLSQQNGQRIYGGPPPNWGSRVAPSRESEIFIGRIPRLCFEDELIPLFSSIGELYEFRLMLDFSGTNRGFAYAQYAEEESALKALKLLNHYEIRPGHYIGVLRCKNNCRLLFSNLKQDLDLNVFSEQIKSLTKEILKISMYKNFEELKTVEIGVTLEVDEAFQERITRYAPESKLAIVEYETHKAAAVARRILIPKLGHTYGIDWAIPPKDSNQFDQALSARFDASLTAGNDFLKIRPVPLFNPPRSSLDGVLYMTSTFRNIAKYFRFLVNITLHKSMRKGDIPLPVYLELEKKIIERVKNIEHCGQATQLLLNYLSWYKEKMMMFIDPESEKILIEVKYYSEKMLEVANARAVLPRGYRYFLEEQSTNTLHVNLNYCYYMAVFLGGDDRDKVCGLITDSLDWFSRMMQRARDGHDEVNQFMTEISRLAIEMEEEKRRTEPFAPPEKIRKRKTELLPAPVQFALGWNPFSGQSFPPLKKNAVISSQRNPNNTGTDSSVKRAERPTAVSICETVDVRVSNQIPNQSSHLEKTSTGQAESMDTDTAPSSSTAVSIYRGGNTNDSTSAVYGRCRRVPCLFRAEFGPHSFNGLCHMAHVIASNVLGGEGCLSFGRMKTFPDLGVGFDSRAAIPVPVLISRPSTTDFSMMPRQFLNICPFYKYVITVNLQKSVERCEVMLHTYRDITTKIIDSITHLEACIEAVELIVGHLRYNREGMVPVTHDHLIQVLEDVRTYASAIVSYVQNRPNVSVNPDLDDYYFRLVPNQMSFLYHLTLLLDEEDKVKLSGRLTESVKWLHELVQKNRTGHVEVVTFFERIIAVGERLNTVGSFRDIIKDAYEEFNTISSLSRGANN